MREDSDLPLPLKQYLNNHSVKNIVLHFDNDAIGITAAEGLKQRLKDDFNVIIDIPQVGKDVNDLLILTTQKFKRREVNCR